MTNGHVALCNGYYTPDPANPNRQVCSGHAFTVPLAIEKGFGALIPAGKAAAVPFSGRVAIRPAQMPGRRGEGVGGPVATAFVDARLVGGARVISAPTRLPIEIEDGALSGGSSCRLPPTPPPPPTSLPLHMSDCLAENPLLPSTPLLALSPAFLLLTPPPHPPF